MTNENTAIATRDTAKPPVQSGGVLAALAPQNLDEAFRLAQALSRSGDMVPQAYRGNPEATMAAIVRGLEIGLAPMQALSAIAVINGRAVIWGDALPALMLRAGHHVDVEIEGEGQKAVAVATLTRGDTGKTYVRRFSMFDADRAGLTKKQGPWQSYPTRMLAMRARAWAIRDGAADALMGLAISDEAEGFENARDITPKPQRRGSVVYIDPEPAVDEIHEAEPATANAAEDLVKDDLFAGEDDAPADDGKPSDEEIAARMAEVERQMQEERERALREAEQGGRSARGQTAPGGLA